MWRDPTYITKEEGFSLKLETKINDDYLVAVRLQNILTLLCHNKIIQILVLILN